MDKINLRIFDKDINFRGEIDSYSSFFYIRKWDDCGEFELRISDLRNIIKNGYYIMINNSSEKAGIIEYIEKLPGDIKEFSVKGFTLGYIIKNRITVPPSNKGYLSFNNTAIEDIIKQLVNFNCVNPENIKRKIPRLEIETSLSRGSKISFQTRYKDLIPEIISLCKIDTLGWNIELDYINKKFIFKVLQGKDLTTTQNVNAPMIFSEKFDNVLSENFVMSNIGYKNMAYTAGQGEEENREIVLVNDNLTGLDRRELFVDARDIAENEKLYDRGNLKLKEYPQILSYDSTVDTKGYEKYWNLGDLVTLSISDSELTLEKPIMQVKETFDTTGFKIEPTFGEPITPLPQKIKQLLEKAPVENKKIVISPERPVGEIKGTIWIK